MKFSDEQRAALDLSKSVALSAGAGSGKTRVLIERYVLALASVGFDLDAVLAVTFTKKATAEMLGRVRDRVTELMTADPSNAASWGRVRERLGEAWILTIDAFCHRVLSTLGPVAGRPAGRSILTGGELAEVQDDAMRDVLDVIAADPGHSEREVLRRLLRVIGRGKLVEEIRHLIERRARSTPWAEAMARSGAGYAASMLAALKPAGPPADLAAMAAEHELQLNLARIFSLVRERYAARLRARNACDFRQLLEDVENAFGDSAVRDAWARRFRHVLVDEFQDTDPGQWGVFRSLFGGERLDRTGLFVVGDEKQAIFSFRDGDVATFRRATEAVAASDGGVARSLRDNYRSSARLLGFFNALSERLFSAADAEFEARHAPMLPRRAEDPSGDVATRVELVVGRNSDTAVARERSYAALAVRARSFVDDGDLVLGRGPDGPRRRPATFDDIAILLRSRKHLRGIEDALVAQGVPFKVLGGVGFFEQPEVCALRSLMRFVSDAGDDLALLGVLRSALFAVPDSVLLAARKLAKTERRSLWDRIEALDRDVAVGAIQLPTPADAAPLHDAALRLARYRRLADRLPGHELLALAARESDLFATLDLIDPSGRAGANVEKLLDLVRRHQSSGLATFDDVERSIALATGATDDPEAQADPPSSGRPAVSILTIHAAKGLEWPVVFLPDCDTTPSGRDPAVPVELPAGGGHAHAIRGDVRGKSGLIRGHVDALEKREREAESKRLLYVAVTRARDHLVMAAGEKIAASACGQGKRAPDPDAAKARWIDWILQCGDHVSILDAGDCGRRFAAEPEPVQAPAASPDVVSRRGDALPSLRIPATSLSILSSCPRRFLLEVIVGAESHHQSSGSGPCDGTDAATRGSIVHAALEGLSYGVDPVQRVGPVASAAGVRDSQVVREIEAHVGAAVRAFAEWPTGAQILAAPPGAVLAEAPIEWGSGPARVVGAADLLFRSEGGEAVVVDFKTDFRPPSGDSAARRYAEERGYSDQLRAYAAAAAAGGRAVSAHLFFTGTGRVTTVVGVGGESIEAATSRVARLLRDAEIESEQGFTLAADPSTCLSCPHKPAGRCPGRL